jgi:hypothetical protein
MRQPVGRIYRRLCARRGIGGDGVGLANAMDLPN